MVDKIDHISKAESRIATQFRESVNLKAYLDAFLRESNELEEAIIDLIEKTGLEEAFGETLNIIGIIVGQERGSIPIVLDVYFGFKGSIGGDTFSTIGDPSVGSNLRSISDIEFTRVVQDDETYRRFIKSKIAKNHSQGTREEAIFSALQIVDSDTQLQVLEEKLKCIFKFSGTLSDSDKLLLLESDLIPKPITVSINYEDDDGKFFLGE